MLQALSERKAVYCISVDIVNDAILGDLTNVDVLAFWKRATASGQVIGIVAGPPCETWSAARFSFMPTPSNKRPPRPIRSIQHPWGKHNLTGRERAQLDLANQLLRATIMFLTLAATEGISAIMEHPSLADWLPAAPSSWRLQEIKMLEKLDHVDMVHIDQCCFGATARKPTTLLAVNLPTLRLRAARTTNGGRCHHPGGHTAAVGQTDDGSWRTAPLKCYPKALCELMAGAIMDHWECLPNRTTDELAETFVPEQFLPVYKALDPYTEEGIFGQDCALFRASGYRDASDTEREVIFEDSCEDSCGEDEATLRRPLCR